MPLVIVSLAIACHIGCAVGSEIKGGAVIENKGIVKLVNNLVVIKKNMTTVKEIESKVTDLLVIVEKVMEKEKDDELREMLTEMLVKIKKLKVGRKRRSLLPFVGNILNGLFGVATEADVSREKERLDRIEQWAKQYGHVFDTVVENLNEQA